MSEHDDYGDNYLRRKRIGWSSAAHHSNRELGDDEVEVQVTDVEGDVYFYGIRPEEEERFFWWVHHNFTDRQSRVVNTGDQYRIEEVKIFTCVSDRYDPSVPNEYSEEEFLDMCESCYDHKPKLCDQGTSDRYDEHGELVLVWVRS